MKKGRLQTRYRKNSEEMEVLWKVFKQNGGKMPQRSQRVHLAAQLKMKEN